MKILKTILSLVAPAAFLRLNMGGGGDGGAGDMRRQEEDRQQKVQQAVDAINARFGVGPQLSPGAAPTREQFTALWGGGVGDENGVGASPATPRFDEDGYNAAMGKYNASAGLGAEAQAAKQAREAMYGDISGAVRDTAMRDLDRQYSDASRKNVFGLARNGLLGGSVDAESGGELSTLYGEGKLKAAQAGMGAASDLRASDEKSRQNLISLAQSGLDTGTAASMAAGQMSAAADLARSQSGQASVGQLFNNMSQAYVTNQVLKSRYPNGSPQQNSSPYSYSGFGANRYTGTAQN